jgi:hypothetical protein
VVTSCNRRGSGKKLLAVHVVSAPSPSAALALGLCPEYYVGQAGEDAESDVADVAGRVGAELGVGVEFVPAPGKFPEASRRCFKYMHRAIIAVAPNLGSEGEAVPERRIAVITGASPGLSK